AAQRVAPRVHRHHRHRRLGRDPLGLPRQIDVEHRVAHHHDALRHHLAEQGLEAVPGEPSLGGEGSHGTLPNVGSGEWYPSVRTGASARAVTNHSPLPTPFASTNHSPLPTICFPHGTCPSLRNR